LNKDEELAKAAIYYKLHREEILKKMAIAYSKKDAASKTNIQSRNKLKYQLDKDEIKAKCATYYKLHREEILKKKALANSKKKLIKK